VVGAVADGLIGGGTIADRFVAGSGFVGDLVKLSSLEINSGLLALLLLVELLTIAELVALVEELLFVGSLAELALVLLTLEVGLIPAEGLVELVALVAVELIFVDGPAPLALLDCLAKLPSIEFSSLKLS
jgi:hypothetical protein